MPSDYMMDNINIILTENVRRGIRKLDEYFGHGLWRNEIDHSTLDLQCYEDCVLGQLFGSFNTGVLSLQIEDTGLFGFDCDAICDEYSDSSWVNRLFYSMLTSIWNDEADGYTYEGMPA